MTFRATSATLALAAALFAPCASANAQGAPDPEALKAAQELVDVSLADGLQDKLVEQSWPALEQVIRKAAPQLGDDQIAGLKTDFVGIMDKEMKEAMADTPTLYAKYFSAQEIRDLLAFYRTDTGRKTLTVMPALLGDVMQRTMSRMPAMMGRIKESFTRILQQKGVAPQ